MGFKRDDRTPQRQPTSARAPNTEESRVHYRQMRQDQEQDVQFVCEEFQALTFSNSDARQVAMPTCM